MKKTYEKPMIEEEKIEVEDICVTSSSSTSSIDHQGSWADHFLN